MIFTIFAELIRKETMKKETPRQQLKKLSDLNGKDGFYGTHAQFAILIEDRLYKQATKIMNSINYGFIWSNERLVHDTIYNQLLDGVSVKEIKAKL
jgi:hypothetical protein